MRANPGTQNFSVLVYKKGSDYTRQIDVETTLERLGLTVDELMKESWSVASVESRLKLAVFASRRGKKK